MTSDGEGAWSGGDLLVSYDDGGDRSVVELRATGILSIAAAWGCTQISGGKVVWATLRLAGER